MLIGYSLSKSLLAIVKDDVDVDRMCFAYYRMDCKCWVAEWEIEW